MSDLTELNKWQEWAGKHCKDAGRTSNYDKSQRKIIDGLIPTAPAKLDPAVVEALEHAVEELETWEMFAKDGKVADADREAARLIRGLYEEGK